MDKLNIMVVGGGGREHAIVKKLSESPRAGKLFCAPGNAGIASLAELIPVKADDINGVIAAARAKNVDLVFVAPDDPLAAGMVDRLEEAGIPAFGPKKSAAVIEASKVFSKNLMKKYGIPTAAYEIFDSPDLAREYVKAHAKYPTVIKAEGLALGKGVIIAQNESEAFDAIAEIMEDRKFGASGNRVVIEDFLKGSEMTVLAFTDGKTVVPMLPSRDHKRAFDGDKGLNTGGMGAISPLKDYTPELQAKCEERIFKPTIAALAAEGRTFSGVIYFGLMISDGEPYVIEYNARFGDPETQVVLPLLDTDLIDIIEAIRAEKLDTIDIAWKKQAAATVVVASGGYPQEYKKGFEISGLDFDFGSDVFVYHAGTAMSEGKYVTAGGRVLAVTALANNVADALDKAYSAIDKINFEGMFFRHDIGSSELK